MKTKKQFLKIFTAGFLLFSSALILGNFIEVQVALGEGDNVLTVDQWKATTSPTTAITQRIAGKPLVLTGYGSGCAQFSATGSLSSTGILCGTGSGGSSLATTTINSATGQAFVFATSSAGTDFNITSSASTVNFNLPYSTATTTGKLSPTDWSIFNSKLGSLNGLTGATQTFSTTTSGSNFTINSSGTNHQFVFPSTPTFSSTTIGTLNLQNPLGLTGGGTGATTTFTNGSILFSDGAKIQQDNANFFWDDNNNRFSVGTNTPITAVPFEVNGAGSFIDQTSLGSEILTNGNYTGNATGWTLNIGFTYNSNAVDKDGNGTGTLIVTTGQTENVAPGEMYKLVFTISNYTAGTVTPSIGTGTGTGIAVSANGTYTQYIVGQLNSTNLAFTPTNTARFTIDSVSFKRVKGGDLSVYGVISTGGASGAVPGNVTGAYIRGTSNVYTSSLTKGIVQINTTTADSGNVSDATRGLFIGIDSTTQSTAGQAYLQYSRGSGGLAGDILLNPLGGSVVVGGTSGDQLFTLEKSGNSYIKVANTSNTFGGGASDFAGVLFQSASPGYSTYEKGGIIYDAYDSTGYGRGRLRFLLDPTQNGANVQDNKTADTVMTVDYTSKVGIGTLSPAAKLHIATTTEQLRLGYDTTNFTKFTVTSTSSLGITPSVNGTSAFNFTNALGTSIFNIDSTNSRIGIGTTTPSNALSVVGDVSISGLTASKPVFTDAAKKLVSGSYNVPQIVSTGDVDATTTAVSNITGTPFVTPNDGVAHQFKIGGYIAVTAISAGTITPQVTFTDENSNVQTLNLFPMGLTSASITTTGFDALTGSTVRAKPNTQIIIKSTFTGVSTTYDFGGTIQSAY